MKRPEIATIIPDIVALAKAHTIECGYSDYEWEQDEDGDWRRVYEPHPEGNEIIYEEGLWEVSITFGAYYQDEEVVLCDFDAFAVYNGHSYYWPELMELVDAVYDTLSHSGNTHSEDTGDNEDRWMKNLQRFLNKTNTNNNGK